MFRSGRGANGVAITLQASEFAINGALYGAGAGSICEVLAGLRSENLSASGRQVTMDLKTVADKDNAVPGRVAAVPLDLAIGHYKTLSVFDVRASEWFVVAFVSDDGDVLTVLHLIVICPISVILAAARAGWVVRLLQFTEPLSDQRINVIPLTKVTCRSLGNGKDKNCCPQSPQ
jgi:hypothetical protein